MSADQTAAEMDDVLKKAGVLWEKGHLHPLWGKHDGHYFQRTHHHGNHRNQNVAGRGSTPSKKACRIAWKSPSISRRTKMNR